MQIEVSNKPAFKHQAIGIEKQHCFSFKNNNNDNNNAHKTPLALEAPFMKNHSIKSFQ